MVVVTRHHLFTLLRREHGYRNPTKLIWSGTFRLCRDSARQSPKAISSLPATTAVGRDSRARTSLITERMKSRHHPYMNLDLLDSQLATLEVPPDAWPVTVAGRPEEAVEEILGRLREAGLLATERRNNDAQYPQP